MQPRSFPLIDEGLIWLANIGNSMIDDGQTTFELDREKVGSLLLHLSDAQLAQNAPQKQAIDHILGSKLSKYAMHFVEQVRPASYSYLFEVRLGQKATSRTLIVLSMCFCNKRTRTAEPGICSLTIWIQSCTGVFFLRKQRTKASDSSCLHSLHVCSLYLSLWCGGRIEL